MNLAEKMVVQARQDNEARIAESRAGENESMLNRIIGWE
jgi:hypothetical protein